MSRHAPIAGKYTRPAATSATQVSKASAKKLLARASKSARDRRSRHATFARKRRAAQRSPPSQEALAPYESSKTALEHLLSGEPARMFHATQIFSTRPATSIEDWVCAVTLLVHLNSDPLLPYIARTLQRIDSALEQMAEDGCIEEEALGPLYAMGSSTAVVRTLIGACDHTGWGNYYHIVELLVRGRHGVMLQYVPNMLEAGQFDFVCLLLDEDYIDECTENGYTDQILAWLPAASDNIMHGRADAMVSPCHTMRLQLLLLGFHDCAWPEPVLNELLSILISVLKSAAGQRVDYVFCDPEEFILPTLPFVVLRLRYLKTPLVVDWVTPMLQLMQEEKVRSTVFRCPFADAYYRHVWNMCV